MATEIPVAKPARDTEAVRQLKSGGVKEVQSKGIVAHTQRPVFFGLTNPSDAKGKGVPELVFSPHVQQFTLSAAKDRPNFLLVTVIMVSQQLRKKSS